MKYALLCSVLLVSACSQETLSDQYDARAESEAAATCAAASCESEATKSFSSLDPIYQVFLIMTFPFWSVGE